MDAQKQMERLIGVPLPFEKSEENGSPLYFQLAKTIQNQIEKGSLKTGEMIPSERKVAAFSQLSVATVRKAFEELVKRGLLTRIHGKGTYVAGTAERRKKIRYYPLVESFKDSQANTGIRQLELAIIPGQPEINQHLKIKPSQELYRLERIIKVGETPLVHSVSYLPRNLFKGLEDCPRTELEDYAVYILFEKKFGITTIEHTELISSVLADEETGRLLGVGPGHPLLKIEKLIFTLKDKPYEYRISHCLTDQLKLRRIM